MSRPSTCGSGRAMPWWLGVGAAAWRAGVRWGWRVAYLLLSTTVAPGALSSSTCRPEPPALGAGEARRDLHLRRRASYVGKPGSCASLCAAELRAPPERRLMRSSHKSMQLLLSCRLRRRGTGSRRQSSLQRSRASSPPAPSWRGSTTASRSPGSSSTLTRTLPRSGLPTSVQQVVPLHIARVLRQMTSLEDTHYSLHNDEFLKDLAVLSFRLVPLGEFSVDLSSGPGRRKLLKCRPVSFVQALRVLRLGAGGLTPIFQAYTHTLAGGRGGKDYLDTSHRLADLAAANPHVKGVVGEAWMEDPNLEFITPHHSLRGRLAASNGGALLRVGCDEVSTALALETSTTRRQLWEEGKYVPTSYMRIWPRHGIVRWSERTRPGSWGPVGLDSRVPPPEWLGRRRRG